MSEAPLIKIIILNWNNAPDTLECLKSVFQLSYDNFQVLVVDNGSEDDSVARIRSSYPDVEILETGSNLGYAEGNNIGIRQAMQAKTDYIFVLNNDTLVASNMLTELVEFAEARPEVGMVGPLMYCTDPADTLFSTGGFIDWRNGETRNRSMFQPQSAGKNSEQPESVHYIAGCGVLVRRGLIEIAGVLDTEYYLNFEDVEWGVRAWRYGFEVWYVPQAIMWHKISATLGQASPANTYYMTRNALLFFWRNAPFHLRWLSILSIIGRTLRTLGAWTLKADYRNDNFRSLRQANLLALRDFFLGRFGQMGPKVLAVCYPNRR